MSNEPTILRKVKNVNYTVVDNGYIDNIKLSWKAKGILTFLLRQPDDWNFNSVHLEKQAADGEESLESGLKELEAAGHLIRHPKKRDAKGKFKRQEWVVYEIAEIKKSYPEGGFPAVGEPAVGNPPLPSTNSTNQVSKDTFTKDTVCIVDKENLKSEIFHRALREGLDWTMPEMAEAWKRYLEYPNSVTDPFRFIKGIIFNLRDNQKKLDRLNKKNKYTPQPKGEKKCYTPIRKDPSASSTMSSESNSKVSLLDLLIQAGQKSKETSKELPSGCKTQLTCLSMLGVMG